MPVSSRETVALARCLHYHPQEVRHGLQKVMQPFGGIETLVKPGQKVLLKPNLLSAAPPAEAVTTHPLVLKVMTELIHEAGGKVFIGDSPGSDSQEKAHQVCGVQEVVQETGAEPLFFSKVNYKKVRGYRLWNIPLAAELDQMDIIINMAKLKTHSLTGMTAAVKNVYGCVPGKTKGRYHFEYPLPADFSRLLIDVYLAVKPAFSIIDAVIAMEGAGPRGGKPRQLGLLMASCNAVALDNVAASVIGFRSEHVSTLSVAGELKLSGSDLSAITVRGLQLEDCRVSDFDKGPASKGSLGRLVALFPVARLRNIIINRRPYPRIDSDLCNGCGVCYENCPAQVINFIGSIPDINFDGCIRCYCCQEFCSKSAIKLTKTK